MALLEQIRNDRVRRRRKMAQQHTPFATVCGLVRQHQLGVAFIERLAAMEGQPHQGMIHRDRVRAKPALSVPLYCLASPGEYRVIRAVMDLAPNPYLAYVHSPEELLVCNALYRRNPSLEAAVLAHHHFETLLLYEMAREESAALERTLESADVAGEPSEVRPILLRARQERLRAFMEVVESTLAQERRLMNHV